jgi:hypothetical protein
MLRFLHSQAAFNSNTFIGGRHYFSCITGSKKQNSLIKKHSLVDRTIFHVFTGSTKQNSHPKATFIGEFFFSAALVFCIFTNSTNYITVSCTTLILLHLTAAPKKLLNHHGEDYKS